MTPNATLTLDDNTPTSILRDLAARALGWTDFPYDPAGDGMTWHCEAENGSYEPVIHKQFWRPDQNADQTIKLITNLGITVSAVDDEFELKTYVLIEAAKIGAKKLGD